MKTRVLRLINLILISSMLTGCGEKTTEVSDINLSGTSDYVYGMLSEADLNYEIPNHSPSILVDTEGYEVSEKKEAIFVGDSLPATFSIKNEETGKTVFTGKIKEFDATEDEADGKKTGIGEFSDLDMEGTYRVTADNLGESLDFSIVTDKMTEIMDKAFEGLDALKCDHMEEVPFEADSEKTMDVSGGFHTSEDGGKDVVTGCLTTLDLLLSFEYNPDSFEDESGNKIPDVLDYVEYETEWLFKMQNSETGGVYTSVSMQELHSGDNETTLVIGGETTKATAYACAVFARCSYILKNYDSAFSARCIQAANKAWLCLDANKDLVAPEQLFRAAVEMYRAQGYGVYHQVVLDYLKSNEDITFDERIKLDGAITYLSTPRYTNTAYCSSLMATFIERTEDKAKIEKASRYLVEYDGLSINEMLRNTCEIVVVNYIMSNVEYEKTARNYLHYLCGRNKDSENLLDFGCDPDSYAELLVVIAKLKNN